MFDIEKALGYSTQDFGRFKWTNPLNAIFFYDRTDDDTAERFNQAFTDATINDDLITEKFVEAEKKNKAQNVGGKAIRRFKF